MTNPPGTLQACTRQRTQAGVQTCSINSTRGRTNTSQLVEHYTGHLWKPINQGTVLTKRHMHELTTTILGHACVRLSPVYQVIRDTCTCSALYCLIRPTTTELPPCHIMHTIACTKIYIAVLYITCTCISENSGGELSLEGGNPGPPPLKP